ncbi:hypothetical protein LWE61_17790 [Sphingobium sufflavum]|uniref:DUF5672 family protein n=1 Tax=Sphingobium sufflavum TaxID=1129547 RepID=UPI001F300C75|nr:DUF5672 family protein [Sphingobium sufflavum]MCE7798393.1 hypothetical protein [Sphingobium sufflavum]
MTGISVAGVQKLNLPDITLCAVTSVLLPETLQALRRCMDVAEFHAVKLFSNAEIDTPSGVSLISVPFLGSRKAYSDFLLRQLAVHVTSSHVLIVQWDGFILDPAAWRDEFLDYDYIGACWPQFRDGHDVGNGGFSLRSARLLDACTRLDIQTDDLEDVQICRLHRRGLEVDHGIRFAHRAIAEAFSFEREKKSGGEFGFHGVFNMPDVLGLKQFARFYRGIDPIFVNRRDHELLARVALNQPFNPHAWNILGVFLRYKAAKLISRILGRH